MSALTEYFVVARTFAAPFVSETIETYVEAGHAEAALEKLAAKYEDGIGIFAADAYSTADDYHRDHNPLVRWRSNKALAVEGATSVYSEGPNKAEINGEWVDIADPKRGRILT